MELESLHSAYVLRREIAKFSTESSSLPSDVTELIKSATSQDAVVLDINKNTSQAELYKHIEDTYDGKGYLSKNTAKKLNKEVSNTFNSLAQDDPRASALYSGYMTAGFSYGTKARFANNLNNTLQNSANIRRAYFPVAK